MINKQIIYAWFPQNDPHRFAKFLFLPISPKPWCLVSEAMVSDPWFLWVCSTMMSRWIAENWKGRISVGWRHLLVFSLYEIGYKTSKMMAIKPIKNHAAFTFFIVEMRSFQAILGWSNHWDLGSLYVPFAHPSLTNTSTSIEYRCHKKDKTPWRPMSSRDSVWCITMQFFRLNQLSSWWRGIPIKSINKMTGLNSGTPLQLDSQGFTKHPRLPWASAHLQFFWMQSCLLLQLAVQNGFHSESESLQLRSTIPFNYGSYPFKPLVLKFPHSWPGLLGTAGRRRGKTDARGGQRSHGGHDVGELDSGCLYSRSSCSSCFS